jgi:hypothetical protein
MTLSSEQLEREAEQNRTRLTDTLQELRERVTPGQVLNQLVEFAGDGAGGEIVRNLGRQVRRNPLSVALVGAGLAWLMMSDRRPYPMGERRPGADDSAERMAAARLAGLSDHATSAAAAGEVAMSAYRHTEEAASDAARRARSVADSAYRGASDVVLEAAHKASDAAAAMGRNAAAATWTFADLCTDQPLVLAGLGVALGAALGAALPSTETEDRLMGEPSDSAKQRAQAWVAKIYPPAGSAVDAAWEADRRRDEQAEAEPLGGAQTPGRSSTDVIAAAATIDRLPSASDDHPCSSTRSARSPAPYGLGTRDHRRRLPQNPPGARQPPQSPQRAPRATARRTRLNARRERPCSGGRTKSSGPGRAGAFRVLDWLASLRFVCTAFP